MNIRALDANAIRKLIAPAELLPLMRNRAGLVRGSRGSAVPAGRGHSFAYLPVPQNGQKGRDHGRRVSEVISRGVVALG